MNVTYEEEITAPVEMVFSYIAEPEKALRWQKNVKGGAIIDSKPGVVGTTFSEEIEEGGKSLKMHGVITDYVENERMGFHLLSRIHEIDVTYAVRGTETGTRLRIDTEIKWKFPMNILSLFYGKRMESEIRSDLKREVGELKELCCP